MDEIEVHEYETKKNKKMIKNLIVFTLSLLIFLSSTGQQINTDRYLKVNHSNGINIIDFYNQINLEKPDTPYSYSEQIKFDEGWCRFYDWKLMKFIPNNNGSNRLSPLSINFTFKDNKIVDSEYSIYTIKSQNGKSYFCIDNRNQACVLSIVKNNNRTYVIIDYSNYSYIYASN